MTTALFLARERELALLEDGLSTSGPPVLIRGPAGIGKTCLVDQMAARAEREGLKVSVTRCFDSQPPISLFALLDGIELASLDCGIGPAGTNGFATNRSSPGVGRLGLFYAVSRHLQGLTADQGLLLAVEDIQWADVETLLLLTYLANQEIAGLTIVLTMRSGASPASDESIIEALAEKCRPLDLRGLDLSDCTELLGDTFRPDEQEFLHTFTGGNPLFLMSLARRLKESGLLYRWNIEEAVQHLDVPPTLAGVIDSQINAMSPEVIEMLQQASCIGVRFDSRLLAENGTLPEALARLLCEAADMGAIVQGGSPEPTEFRFAHPLYRDQVYKGIGDAKRRSLHSHLAQFAAANRGVLSAQEMAIHSAKGFAHTDPETALTACASAAEHAEEAMAFDQAASFWSLCLSVLPAGDLERRASILMRLGLARRAESNWVQAITTLRRAHELYERLEDREKTAEAAYFLGEMHRFTSESNECITWLERALPSLAEELRPNAQALLASALIAIDRTDEGLAIVRPLIAADPASIPPHVAYWAAYSLASAGETDAALALSQAGLKKAQEQGDGTQVAMIAGNLTFAAVHTLRLQEAKEFAQIASLAPQPLEAHAVVRIAYAGYIVGAYEGRWRELKELCGKWLHDVRLASEFHRATAELLSAEASSALGDHDEALKIMSSAMSHIAGMAPLAALHQARMLLRAGRRQEAADVYSQVADKAETITHSPGTLLTLADLAASLGDTERLGRLAEILSQASRQILAIYVPLSVQRVRGKVASTLGRYDEAFSHFETAIDELSCGDAAYEHAVALLDYSFARSRRKKRGDALKASALRAEAQERFAALSLPLPLEADCNGHEAAPARYGLSPRQLEVLRLVAQGSKNKEIAEALSLTPTTVARHIEAILSKMAAANRTDAVVRGQRAGLISTDG